MTVCLPKCLPDQSHKSQISDFQKIQLSILMIIIYLVKIALNKTNLNKIPIDFYVKKLYALDQQSFKQLHAAYM